MKTKVTFKRAGLKSEKRKFPGRQGYTPVSGKDSLATKHVVINYLASFKTPN